MAFQLIATLAGVRQKLQNSSGGIFQIYIHKKFSGRILFCTSLAFNILLSKIIKLPTTTVLKLDFAYLLHHFAVQCYRLNSCPVFTY